MGRGRIFIPHHKSKGKTRYYSSEQLTNQRKEEKALTLAYARVSSHDRKADLERQATALSLTVQNKAGITK